NPPPVDVLLGSGPLTSVDFGLYPMAGVPTFGGGVWKYAQELPDTLAPAIRALIDGVDCTMPALRPPGVTYRIRVAPALLVLGCGVLGATIRFTVNGELANETAVWQRDSAAELPPTFGPTLLSPPGVVPPEGAGNRFLELTVGPPFAVYRGEMSRIKDGRLVPVTSEEEVAVEAFIDGVLCGTGGNLTRLGSDVVVLSEALRPGCGRPDAVVRFFVNGAPVEDEDGNLASRETTVWEPGFHRKHFVFREAADSAPVPSRGLISPPDTGDAGLR
ncbi:MAG TPA: hypothetical protein VNN21_03810, partial [Dehalococcoidia bacterium]|nr:hypothetical protein [Dehalococcoidia bacterium]